MNEDQRVRIVKIDTEAGPQLYAPVELATDRLELVDCVHIGRNAIRLIFLLTDVIRTFDLAVESVVNGNIRTNLRVASYGVRKRTAKKVSRAR